MPKSKVRMGTLEVTFKGDLGPLDVPGATSALGEDIKQFIQRWLDDAQAAGAVSAVS